ncbi:MAG: hypothetical protein WBO73_19645 [Gammaproteobacteria bacterium]|jgi:hypothetical protein
MAIFFVLGKNSGKLKQCERAFPVWFFSVTVHVVLPDKSHYLIFLIFFLREVSLESFAVGPAKENPEQFLQQLIEGNNTIQQPKSLTQ